MAKRRNTYAASEVARRLDIYVGALRRRPDVKPVRTESKHRRYSAKLVSEIEMKLMAEAIGPGWTVSHSHRITATAPDGWAETVELSDGMWSSEVSAMRESLAGSFRFRHAQEQNQVGK